MSNPPTPSSRVLTVCLVALLAGLALVWLPSAAWGTSISGRTWQDDDGNGLQGAEPDLAYVEVRLLDVPGLTVQLTTFTDVSGFYLFPELTPGDYVVEFVAPTGEMWSPQDVGGDDTIDSDADPADGRTSTIALLAGVDADADAGIAGRGEISFRAWDDLDGDGIQDGGESFLDNVEVRLLDSGTLTVLASAYTFGGVYNFAEVLPGSYVIEVVVPTGELFSPKDVGSDFSDSDVDPVTGRSDPFVLASQGFVSVDAGVAGRGALGGRFWSDTDGDGIQDGGEPFLDDIEVRLLDEATLTVQRRTYTFSGGVWEFTHVLPGSYVIEYVAPTGELLSPKDAGFDDFADSDVDPLTGRSDPFVVVADGYEYIDGGVAGRGALGGRFWSDTDGDGIQDGGEPFLDDIEVRLLDEATLTLQRRTYTFFGGVWEFTHVLPGSYVIEYVAPTGELLSPKDAGFDDFADSDVDPLTGRSDPFVVVADGYEYIDGGVAGRGALGGRFWSDTDADGIQDGGEPFLDDIEVRLLDEATLTVQRRTYTFSGGVWEFTHVLPGSYIIEYVAPTGELLSPKDAGFDDFADSDVDPLTGRSDPIVVVADGYEYIDGGVAGRGALGGRAWFDEDADGTQGGSEPSLDDIEVRLLDEATLTVQRVTYTFFGGVWEFTDVLPGNYVVEYVAPTGDQISPKDVGGDDSIDSDVDSVTGRSDPLVIVADGYEYVDAGFEGKGLITGRVWQDNNADGIQDGGEPDLDDIEVRLLDSGTLAILEVTYTLFGVYEFFELPTDTYIVEVVAPAGETFSPKDAGMDDGIDSDFDTATGRSDPIAVVPQSGPIADAGLSGPRVATGGDVMGRAWDDVDGDGIQDGGEAGWPKLTVQVLDSGTFAVVATTFTDTNGDYRIPDVPAGSYLVEFVAPADEVFTLADQGADDTVDSDADLATSRGPVFALAAFAVVDFDVGIEGRGEVTGTVWEDVDGDGIFDGSEVAYEEPVEVHLLDPGLTILQTVVTNASGDYRFPRLPVADYVVEFVPPVEEMLSPQDAGVDDSIDSDPDPLTGRVALFAVDADTVTDYDAGFIGRGEVTGSVWEDVDGDGIFDGTEVIYEEPVEVQLLDSGLTILQTVWTNASGVYRFPRLELGDYVVEFVPPVEETLSPQDVGGDDSIDSDPDPLTGQVALFAVDPNTVTDYDAGFIGRGEVTGSVWEDIDGDGIFDGTEVIYEEPVEVHLLDPGLAILETVWTNASGVYRFPRLELGDYVVEFVPPVEETLSPQDVGGDDSIDSDPDPLTGQVALFAVDPNTVTDYDAGFIGRGEVTGGVWEDIDGDGIFDGTEVIYEEPVEVRLLDPGLSILETVFTNASGVYRFPRLELGDYVVEFVPPVEETLSPQDVGGDDSIDSDPDPLTGQVALFAVDPNTVTDYDAGFIGRGEVTGRVWEDIDGDGVQDGGELSLVGEEVRLLDPALSLLQSVVTDSSGIYRFPQLELGDYVVEFVPPTGEVFSPQDAAGDDLIDSDPDPLTGQVALFAVDPNTVTDYDAGIQGRGQVVGRAWQDENGDGVQDAGEPSLGTVTVRLLDPALNPIYESFTGLGGLYLFPRLPADDYVVEFVARAGEMFSPQDVGADSDDSDVDTGTGRVGPFPVDPNTVQDYDSGLVAATWAPLASPRALIDGPRTVVEWRTNAEVGTAGFELYRVEEDGREVRVHEGLVPALFGDIGGGVYRVVDDSASHLGELTYRLVEVESDGGRGDHGAFTLDLEVDREVDPQADSNAPRAKTADEAGFVRTVQPETARSRERSADRAALAATAKKAKPSGTGGGPGGGPADALTIRVEGRGLVHLDAASMADALGLPVQAIEQRIRGGRLSLLHAPSGNGPADDEVAWLADEDDSGLSFYAAGLDHPASLYSRHDAYRLELDWGVTMDTADGGAPAPASADASFSARERYEENVFAVTSLPLADDEDPWFWHYVLAGNPVHGARTFTVEVDEVAADSLVEASLAVRLRGAGQADRADDHRAVVSLNGWELGSLRWSGLESATATFDVDPALLVSGENDFEVRGVLEPGVDYSLFVIDHFELVYPRTYRATQPSLHFEAAGNDVVTLRGLGSPDATVLDVTDPLRPLRVENLSAGQDADGWHLSFLTSSPDARYVVVHLATTEPGGELSAELRPTEGERLRAKNNRAEYLVISPPEFADAARELADLRQSQGLMTQVVTLDEIVDEFHHGVFHPRAIRDFLAYASDEWSLPPRYVVLAGNGTFDYLDHMSLGDNLLPPWLVSSPQGLHPSDSRLVDVVDEQGVFDGPEMVIGRIPATTPAELSDYVQKVANFESGASTGRVLMSADNPDPGGDFPADSDALAGWLHPTSVSTAYLSELSVADARAAVFQALDQGVDHVNYVGHGALRNLAAEGLLTTTDVAAMENLRQPVVTALTCTSNFFASPGVESLGEALVLRQDGGAVAVWAPSWLSANGQATDLASTFFAEYYAGSGARLGDAILHALRQAAAGGTPPAQLDGFVLLGDPAILRPEGRF